MKKNNIKFKLSKEFCLEKAEEYYEEGDLVLSLSYLDRVCENELTRPAFEKYCLLRSQITHVFGTEAGNFWALKYFAKHGYSEKLAPLIAYATIENDKKLNGYKNDDLPEFLQEIMSSIEDIEGIEKAEIAEIVTQSQKQPPRKLMFSRDMIAEKALENGDKLMKAGRFEDAIMQFKEVPKSAKKYPDALSNIALCHLFIGNYKKSYEINIMVLENYPDFLQSLLQMMSLCNILEKGEEFKKYMDIVQSKKHDPTDSIKVANILIDARKYAEAIPHFEFAFENLNYSLEGYVTYIITLYNAGNKKRGVIELKEILKFFPDNAVLWQLLYEMQHGETVSYETLFAEKVKACVDRGVKIAKSPKLCEETFKDSKKLAYLKYACGKTTEAIEYFDKIIDFENGRKMFCELLYHQATTNVQRANILRYLMKNNFEGKVLFRGSAYRYLKISYPPCVYHSRSLFIAYAFAFSTLAYFESDFEAGLKRAMISFLKNCLKKEIAFEELFTPDMISAVVIAKLGKLDFDIICEFAGVEKKKFVYVGRLVFGDKFGRESEK